MTRPSVDRSDGTKNYHTMPVQKPGRSIQTYGTPPELIQAVENRWGALAIDLAASKENAKAPYFFSEEMNSLTREWNILGAQFGLNRPLLWLNPPFANITNWAEKCRYEARNGARIILLVPASIGSEWFAEYVWGSARVVALRPRLTFQGCSDPYPKDCVLCLYGPGFESEPAFQTWRWK